MAKYFFFLVSFLFLATSSAAASSTCGHKGAWLQVLGSGGPELNDRRASSSYLVWLDGKARIMVDMGSGSLLRFEESGARIPDLDLVLFSHFHADHANDLPALVKAAYFTNRKRDLSLYGPTGNNLMPSTKQFVESLFGRKGAYKYLNSYLDGSDDFKLLLNNVNVTKKSVQKIKIASPYSISAVAVHHGPIPALAWRVDIENKSIVFSGDMTNDFHTLAGLAKNASILVAHHAIPETASGAARNLHMPPSEIGKIAANAGVKRLVLSHRMIRTVGQENISTIEIRRSYQGPIYFADDLQCFKL